ncbi:MAG TPA: acyl-CoA thioesterase [Cellulomonas sp.]
MYLRLLLLRARARRRGPLSVWDTARTPMRVGLRDLDLLRHVNNGTYLTMLDLGRLDLLTRSGFWATITAKGWYPVVAGQTITYRRSLTWGQSFDLCTRILGFHDRWVYVEQTFCRGDVVHAQAIVRARFLRRSGGTVDSEEIRAISGDAPDDRSVPGWVQAWSVQSRVVGEEFRPANLDA